MEAKYKVGDRVDINRDNEILEGEVFGHFQVSGKLFYSIKHNSAFYLIEAKEILERPNE